MPKATTKRPQRHRRAPTRYTEGGAAVTANLQPTPELPSTSGVRADGANQPAPTERTGEEGVTIRDGLAARQPEPTGTVQTQQDGGPAATGPTMAQSGQPVTPQVQPTLQTNPTLGPYQQGPAATLPVPPVWLSHVCSHPVVPPPPGFPPRPAGLPCLWCTQQWMAPPQYQQPGAPFHPTWPNSPLHQQTWTAVPQMPQAQPAWMGPAPNQPAWTGSTNPPAAAATTPTSSGRIHHASAHDGRQCTYIW